MGGAFYKHVAPRALRLPMEGAGRAGPATALLHSKSLTPKCPVLVCIVTNSENGAPAFMSAASLKFIHINQDQTACFHE